MKPQGLGHRIEDCRPSADFVGADSEDVGGTAILAGKVGWSVRQSRGQVSGQSVAARGPVQSDLQVYLREIQQVPLLTADEERELGWAIINDNCPVSRERMIRANLRLVVAIAKNYSNRGLTLSDLIEEGNIGLMRAVDGFDPAQGARFSTYGSWWIKQAIKRALINASQPVHIPGYMVELVAKWKLASRKLEGELGYPPSLPELAKAMDMPLDKMKMIKRAVKAFQTPAQEPSNGFAATTGTIDSLSDQGANCPASRVFQTEELETLRKLLETIDDREAQILRMRFGLDGCEPLTLKQISDDLKISRERVRQICDEALTKLNSRMNDARPSRFFRQGEAEETIELGEE